MNLYVSMGSFKYMLGLLALSTCALSLSAKFYEHPPNLGRNVPTNSASNRNRFGRGKLLVLGEERGGMMV